MSNITKREGPHTCEAPGVQGTWVPTINSSNLEGWVKLSTNVLPPPSMESPPLSIGWEAVTVLCIQKENKGDILSTNYTVYIHVERDILSTNYTVYIEREKGRHNKYWITKREFIVYGAFTANKIIVKLII